eukprot:gene20482-24580_t
MSIYEDILRAQVKQGNFGGKKGPFAYLAKDNRKEKNAKKERKYVTAGAESSKLYKITLVSGTVANATDSNGLSDPYARIGKISPKLFESKWIFETKADPKTLTPQWNESEEVYLDIRNKHQFLIVQLWDRDMLKDDFIGSCLIKMSLINDTPGVDNVTKYDVFSKPDDKVPSGTVTVSFKVEYKAGSANYMTC